MDSVNLNVSLVGSGEQEQIHGLFMCSAKGRLNMLRHPTCDYWLIRAIETVTWRATFVRDHISPPSLLHLWCLKAHQTVPGNETDIWFFNGCAPRQLRPRFRQVLPVESASCSNAASTQSALLVISMAQAPAARLGDLHGLGPQLLFYPSSGWDSLLHESRQPLVTLLEPGIAYPSLGYCQLSQAHRGATSIVVLYYSSAGTHQSSVSLIVFYCRRPWRLLSITWLP